MGIASVVNGVDVERLSSTITAIKSDVDLARFKFRSKNTWINGGHNRSTVKDFYGAGKEDASRDRPFVLDADEPEVLLGGDSGANPVEFLLHALAGCLTTSLIYHAAAQGITINAVESTYEGELDLQGFLGLSPEVRSGYQNIQVTFRIESNAPEEKLKELCEVAQKRSPVFNSLSLGVPISVRINSGMPAAQSADTSSRAS
jgi:uncharacterized OsmC-like protein